MFGRNSEFTDRSTARQFQHQAKVTSTHNRCIFHILRPSPFSELAFLIVNGTQLNPGSFTAGDRGFPGSAMVVQCPHSASHSYWWPQHCYASDQHEVKAHWTLSHRSPPYSASPVVMGIRSHFRIKRKKCSYVAMD